jgi:2-dehydro-3-deoxyphosphooctonate aldolase (KDO 8-P synthase)
LLSNPASIGSVRCGDRSPLVLIAGPCVIESLELTQRIADSLSTCCRSRSIPLIFKASFDKANRTSGRSFRGCGMDAGLRVLETIGRQFELPVTTDIHESHQAVAVADVCQLIQIPAFLARQTDLLTAAARTGRAVNVKKGQFMAPDDMQYVVKKLEAAGAQNVLLTERGTFFGYGQLVNDFRSLPVMRSLGVPVVFDATHSVQFPGTADGATGGNREMVIPLARAAVATGVDALFLETHPDPDRSPSDGPNMLPLEALPDLLDVLLRIRDAVELPTHSSP